MPSLISQEELLGDLLPSVYFDGITLESSGQPPEDDDPHIDHQRERANRDKDTPNSLLVTADLCLKEKLDTSLIGRWFGDSGKFTNYIKLMVVVSTNPFVTKAFSRNNQAIALANKWGHWDVNSKSVKTLKKDFKINDVADLKREFYSKDNFQVKVLTINQDVLGDNKDLTQHKSHTDSDGNTIHDINFRASFKVRTEKPQHLACFAVAYLDMPALVDAYNLDVDEHTLKNQNGKCSAEVVIDNYNIVGNTNVFYTTAGVIWTGPIHKSGKTWRTGSNASEGGERLRHSTVPNTKIQDFRNIKEIKRLEINLAVIEQELFAAKNKFKGIKNDKMTPRRKNAYFSDCYLTRSDVGAARLCFAVDYEKLVREQSLYGKLLETKSKHTKRKLLTESKIRSLKFKRRRIKNVKTQNKLGAPIMGEVLFDSGEYPNMLSIGGEAASGRFSTSRKYNGGGWIKEVDVLLDSPQQSGRGLRFFTGEDWEMKSITDGDYQYGVEITVEDATVEYLDKVLSGLLHHRNRLNRYYHESTKLGMTKYIVELEDPHIDSTMERSAILKNSPGNYDPISNRFTQHFIDTQTKRWDGSFANGKSKIRYAPWVSPLINYMINLHMLTNSFESAAGWKILKAIYSYISPATGSPKGIMVFVKLMDDLIMKLSGLIGADVTFTTDRRERGYWRTHTHGPDRNLVKRSRTPTKTSTVEHWFSNNSFDSEVANNVGFDYLSSGLSTKSAASRGGLRQINGEAWKKRVEEEVLRYFKSPSVDINMRIGSNILTERDSLKRTNFTFFAPSFVYLDNNATSLVMDASSLTASVYDDDHLSVLESSILLYKSTTTPRFPVDARSAGCMPVMAHKFKENMQMFFADLNLTIEAPSQIESLPLTDRYFLNNQVFRSPNFEMCDLLGDIPDDTNLDPIVLVPKTNCDPDEEQACINPNTLFMSLMRPFSSTGATGAKSTNSPYEEPRHTAKLHYGELNLDTIEAYNLNVETNIVNLLVQDPSYINTIMVSCGYPASDTYSIQDAIHALPNHFKSLFLASVKSEAVSRNWFSLGYDPVKHIKTSSYFKFNFGLIRRTDVLTGYMNKKGADGIEIKEPQWEPLTMNRWQDAIGEILLCRHKPFSCPLLGVRGSVGMQLPIYDEYFFLRPPLRSKRKTPDSRILDSGDIFDSETSVEDNTVALDNATRDVPPSATATNIPGIEVLRFDCPPFGKDETLTKPWCVDPCILKTRR